MPFCMEGEATAWGGEASCLGPGGQGERGAGRRCVVMPCARGGWSEVFLSVDVLALGQEKLLALGGLPQTPLLGRDSVLCKL